MRLIILAPALLVAGSLNAQDTAPVETKPESFEGVPADAGQPFGGMAISPTRVVVEGNRGGQVMIYNSSTETVSYRIEAVDLSIDENGQHTPAEGDVPAWSALPHIRYAPRQVTLAPGQRQAIKIIARPAQGTPAGELRSHMRFSSIPLVAPVDDTPAPEDENGNRTVEVSVGMDFRVTIPVLLRIGDTTGGAAIEKVILNADASNRTAQVTIARTGTRSDYGTIRLLAADGSVVGLLRGVSVPPPLARRNFPVQVTGKMQPVKAVYVEELPGLRDGDVIAERAID